MPEARIAFRPFDEQLAFFKRKINMPTARWDDLRLGDHAHGFMVAGLAREDVLNDMREAIVAAMQGETLEDFRKRFDDLVLGRWEGFTGDGTAKGRAWRTRIIYRTNIRTSYMAGRWETLRKFPFLRYNHHTILNPRENHLAWDDLIIATDDPWWAIHYPPNGWGCACDATGVSEQRLRAIGRQPDMAPPLIDGDPPPEWSYHVGESARSLPVAAAFGQRVMQLPPAWRDIALADAARRTDDLFSEWPAMLDALGALDSLVSIPPSWSASVGFISTAIAAFVDNRVAISTAALAVDGRALASAQIDVVLLRDALQRLPQELAGATIYFDASSRSLVAAQRQGDVIIAWTFSERSTPLVALWAQSIRIVDAADLRDLQLIDGPAL